MTDDWRRDRRDDNDFGPPLFGDDPAPDPWRGDGFRSDEPVSPANLATDELSAVSSSAADWDDLSFGEGTGELPHWTEPPTGELPRTLQSGRTESSGDDVDVWSSFSGSQPVWQAGPSDGGGRAGSDADDYDEFDDLSAGLDRPIAASDPTMEDPFLDDLSVPTARPASRITIGTDPTDYGRGGDGRRPADRGRRPGAASAAGGRASTAGVGGRNMPLAIGVGVAIAAVFVGALVTKPWAVLAIILAVLGLSALEFYDKVAEKGYQPAAIAGIFTVVALPAAAYWFGMGQDERVVSLLLVVGFAAGCATFVGGSDVESRPLANMAITTLGVMWVGVMGVFAVLILNWSNVALPVADLAAAAPGGFRLSNDVGTDTLMLLAIGVVANDVGALFVGSSFGRRPLRAWISPNKSVEGFIGGALVTVLALQLVGFTDRSTTWNSAGDLLLLGLVIAIFAPLGDLTESMFKRNLDVKDFGTMVAGHGGMLDRFDGFLFVLPAVYYLTLALEPFAS
jgi:phosphatidate cytidylyltransferase